MNRKRNDYLDLSDEESELAGSDHNDFEDSRLFRVSAKRRKLGNAESDEDSPDSDDPAENADSRDLVTGTPSRSQSKDESTLQTTKPASSTLQNPKLKPLTPSQLASSQRKARKTGVVYLSRIPPFMKPATLRHLLSPYGLLKRVFLTPESTTIRTKRKRSGGNKKRSFIDGWVEFASKKKAKICVETLNANVIGGKKGGWYHDDLWNLKYLKGFKWEDLMEQVQHEEQVRDSRLRAEIQSEARERRLFLENVERAKGEKGMEAKRARKKGVRGDDGDELDGEALERVGRERTFRQNKVKERDKGLESYDQQEDVKRVLSKIF
ncbi:RNA-binding ATPase activator esf2 [Thelotrema lepadinum]|nr:RNA-binding ATPase activator esf2 [Thelotrema lepadinum]